MIILAFLGGAFVGLAVGIFLGGGLYAYLAENIRPLR